MLRDTPVELRQALVIGLGDVGRLTVKGVEHLLHERLGDVPVIGLVTLEADFAQAGSQIVVERRPPNGWHLRLPLADSSGDPVSISQPIIQRTSSSLRIDTSVPGTGGDPTQLRRTGRLAILRWASSLNDVLGEIHRSVRAMDNRTAVSQRKDHKMVMDESRLLDVFVIAALDEPFASGAFLDLAYLVDYVLGHEADAGFYYQTNGILYLPTYPIKEGSAGSMNMREADTYAALKELDYYTSSAAYSFDTKAGLKFKVNSPPFKTNCFLVDSTNEENRTISNLDHLTMMVADWLYCFLTSPLAASFRNPGMGLASRKSQGRVTAYSGFGIASRVLPIEDVIEVSGVRLGRDIVQNHLLSAIKGGDEGALRGAQVFSRDRVATILEGTLLSEADALKFRDVPTQNFENITLWEFNQLRERVKKEFVVNKRNRGLPSKNAELRKALDQKIDTMRRTTLPEEVNSIVDAPDASCIDRALSFLDRLRREMEASSQKASSQVTAAKKREQEADQVIARTRADYKSATEAIRPGSLIFMVVALVPIVGVLAYMLRILLTLLPGLDLPLLGGRSLALEPFNVVAAVLVILGNLAILAAAVRHLMVWPPRTKDAYIGAHRDRLDTILKRNQAEQSAYFYNVMQRVASDEMVRITELRDRVDLIGKELEKKMAKPPKLDGALHHTMEESVLEPPDLDQFYREMIRSGAEANRTDLGRYIGRMTQTKAIGRVSTWIKRDPQEIVDGIIEFGKRAMDPLRRRKSAEGMLIVHLKGPEFEEDERIDVLVEMLSKDPQDEQAATFFKLPSLTPSQDQELRNVANELVQCASPFLRFAKARIEAEFDQPLTTALGTYDATTDNWPLNRLVTTYYDKIQRVSTGDPHAIVVMSVRHGLPLNSLGNATRYKANYERYFQDKQLHTRREHMNVPDLFPLAKDAVEPQMAVALGCVLLRPGTSTPLIEQQPDTGLVYRYEPQGRAPVEVKLGKDKIGACIVLQQSPDDLVRLSLQIDQAVIQLARAAPDGNQVVIKQLEDYIRAHERQLEEWELSMVSQYVERLR